MSKYSQLYSSPVTQLEKSKDNQVINNAGGYVFKLDPFKQLERFLILGSDSPTYYVSAKKLTVENAEIILACADIDPVRTVNTIVDVSTKGRAAKNDSAIFALALLVKTKAAREAQHAMNLVCRTGTHLFQFVSTINEIATWNRSNRKCVSEWYLQKTPDELAMQVTKYASREGWTHKDVLRLAHPKCDSKDINDIFQYVTKKDEWLESKRPGHRLLVTVEEAKTASEQQLVKWISEEGLVREHIPTNHLNSVAIWEALLENMPMTALIRNLAKMTQIGLLKPLSAATKKICDRLSDSDFLKKSRIHPFNILTAISTYSNGYGFRGSNTWNPVQQIISALDGAFYKSFDYVESTGKRFLLGIDVSGSMSTALNNSCVTACQAAACMAMLAMRTEANSYALGFCNRFVDLGIDNSMSLEQATARAHNNNFGSTDCALPMLHALQSKLDVDVFCVYTDNETYAGKCHPYVALEKYRKETGIDAKLVVFGMTSTGFTIANPDDHGMLDVVGFDASAPQVLHNFVK